MVTGRLSISITFASDLGCISVSRLIPREDGTGDYTLLLAQNGSFLNMQSLVRVFDESVQSPEAFLRLTTMVLRGSQWGHPQPLDSGEPDFRRAFIVG